MYQQDATIFQHLKSKMVFDTRIRTKFRDDVFITSRWFKEYNSPDKYFLKYEFVILRVDVILPFQDENIITDVALYDDFMQVDRSSMLWGYSYISIVISFVWFVRALFTF